jgi:hypothetical protein
MKLGYSVTVSDSREPKFPGYCVVCGQPHKEDQGIIEMTLKAHMTSVVFYAANIMKIAEHRHVMKIPGHAKCINGLRRQFWQRYFVLAIIAVSVTIFGMFNNWNKYYGGLIVILIGAPFIYWELAHPLPIEYDHDRGQYIFTFKDRIYADNFAALNQTEMKEIR